MPPPFQVAPPTEEELRNRRSVPELVNTAIQRRDALAQGLASGIDPDATARYIDPRRRAAMIAEMNAFGNEAHAQAIQQANQAQRELTLERNTRATTQFANLVSGIRNIQAPIGTKEHADQVFGLVTDNIEGAMTVAGRQLIEPHVKLHDAAASLTSAITPTMKPKSVTRNAKGEESVTYQEPTAPKGETIEQYKARLEGIGLTPYDFQNLNKWTHAGGQVYRTPEPIGGKLVAGEPITLDEETFQALVGDYRKHYPKAKGGAEATTAKGEITSQAEYDALPAGAEFVWKGKRGRKPTQ